MSTMQLVQCVVCGEVFEEHIPVCPGCRSRLGARPLTELQVIQNSQREAKQDSSLSVGMLTLLGIFVLVPFTIAMANFTGLPIGIGLLLAAIVFTATIVFAASQTRSPPVEYRGEPASSVVNPYQVISDGYQAPQQNAAVSAVKVILYALLGIGCAVGVLIIGFIVFLYIVCAPMFN